MFRAHFIPIYSFAGGTFAFRMCSDWSWAGFTRRSCCYLFQPGDTYMCAIWKHNFKLFFISEKIPVRAEVNNKLLR